MRNTGGHLGQGYVINKDEWCLVAYSLVFVFMTRLLRRQSAIGTEDTVNMQTHTASALVEYTI